MRKETRSKEHPAPGWRVPLGAGLFVIGWCTPLLIPLVTASGLATGWKTIISGALAIGIPEVFSIVAIAIMGKEGFAYLKGRVFGFLKKHGPPDQVGRTRYHIGLVMFALPLLFGWLGPYVIHRIPGYEPCRFWISLVGDVMFVSSLFVLGGDFWDKVRALFIHRAKAQIPLK